MKAEDRSGSGSPGEISRRQFCQVTAVGLGGFAIGGYLGLPAARAGQRSPLLPPIVTGYSTEICLNSRVSTHATLSGTASAQQIANVLWAAGRAPVVGSNRTIYFKNQSGRYIYHPEDHSLEYYSSETATNAIRINYDRQLEFDAGVSYMFALLASVSLRTGTSSQLINCPQMSDLNFGIGTATALTSQVVAVSSNGTLPNPVADGTNDLERVIADIRLRDRFRTDLDLTPQRLAQILWSGYGCTPHMATSKAGLTVPSWQALYFLTNHIYVVNNQVSRYCNHVGTNMATRDHRLDLVNSVDRRDALRQALPDLPHAPCYILICLTLSDLATWYKRLEVGFAAGGMLLQSGASGLACGFKAELSSAEQTAVQQATQIPAADYPVAVVCLGHRIADLDGDADVDGADVESFGGCLSGPHAAADPGCNAADVDDDGDVDLDDFAALQLD